MFCSSLSLTVYAIFANQIKFQKFDLENEGQEVENETCAVRLIIFNTTEHTFA